MTNRHDQVFALRNGTSVHISEVERGLKSGCICPACGQPLIAKKGSQMKHHFAHKSGIFCDKAVETSLHYAAKDIIAESCVFRIPAAYVTFPNSGKAPLLLSDAKEIRIDRVDVETATDCIVPDLILYSGGKRLMVEIYVTHAVDEAKREAIQNLGISTLEIDLSSEDRDITRESLREILLKDSSRKRWIYNAMTQKVYQEFLSATQKMPIIHRGLAIHVDWCPIQSRIWKGKPYANVMDDCSYCQFNISRSVDDQSLYCSGYLRLSELQDLYRYKQTQQVSQEQQ